MRFKVGDYVEVIREGWHTLTRRGVLRALETATEPVKIRGKIVSFHMENKAFVAIDNGVELGFSNTSHPAKHGINLVDTQHLVKVNENMRDGRESIYEH